MKNTELIAKNATGAYSAPEIQFIKVNIENGFATSGASIQNLGVDSQEEEW